MRIHVLVPALIVSTFLIGALSNPRTSLAGGTSVGSGATYSEAYKNAMSSVPKGARVTGAQGRQSGNTWTVTIVYS